MDLTRSRVLRDTLLVVVGCLLMLEASGVWHASVVLPVTFGAAGLAFLRAFFGDGAGCPWAALLGLSLLGLAASALWQELTPGTAAGWAGSLSLGGIGAGYFAAYPAVHERWRSLIPGGAIFAMAIVAVLLASLGEHAAAGCSSWGCPPRSA